MIEKLKSPDVCRHYRFDGEKHGCALLGECRPADEGKPLSSCQKFSAVQRKSPVLVVQSDDDMEEHCPCAKKSVARSIVANRNKALITLNIGNVLCQKSRDSMRDAARRWDADYCEITEPIQRVGGRPHWQKALLAKWAGQRGYERCVYYDADILIRSDCPDVIELTPQGSLGIVSNDQIDGVLWKPAPHNRYWPSLQSWAGRLNMRCPPLHEHANSGMIVFEPKTHADLFEAWFAAGKSCGFGAPAKLIDQAAFSVLAHNMLDDTSRTWLPMMFNALIYRHELIRSAGQMQAFVYHYTGHRKNKINDTEWRVGARSAVKADPVPSASQRTPSATLLGNDVDVSRLVDRAVCINLDRRYDRWQKFSAELPMPWPFPDPAPVRAIDVKRCPPPEWFAHEDGQWGCLRSHLRVIEDALNDGVESLLVLEDDAQFREGFLGHLHHFLSHVPDDWEMLFLGGCHTRGRRIAINQFVEIPGYVTLAHAYILRRSAMTLFYEHAYKHTPERSEIDHKLGKFSESYGCAVYAPRSWLVYQAAGFSDLRLAHRPLRGLTQQDATK